MFRFARALEWLDDNSRGDAVTPPAERFRARFITRRTLLAGSASVSAGLLIPSNVAAPIDISFGSDHITVRLSEYIWYIDRSSFGASAKFDYRREGSRHLITVHRSFTGSVGLSVDFSAILQVIDGQWWVSLEFAQLGARFRVPFEPWLAGRYRASSQGYINAVRIGAASANMVLLPQAAAISLTPDWRFEWEGDSAVTSIQLDGLLLRSTRSRLTLGERRAASLADLLNIDAPQGHAALDLIAPDISDSAAVPGLVGSHTFQLRFDAISTARVAIIGERHGSAAVVVCVTGEASANVLSSPHAGPDTPVLSQLRLAPVSLIAPSSDLRDQRLLLARVTPAAHAIETPDMVFTVAGHRDAGIVTAFRGGVSAPIRIRTDLYTAAVPVAGADRSEIAFTQTPLHIDIGGEAPTQTPEENPWLMARSETAVLPIKNVQLKDVQPADAADICTEDGPCAKDKTGLLLLNRVPFFAAPLERGRLRILRSRDLLESDVWIPQLHY